MKNKSLVDFNRFRNLCLKNAKSALDAAQELTGKGFNHLAFHLTVLSLEEIGKIFMYWMQISRREKWEDDNPEMAMDSHVEKLFYSIWVPSIGTEQITTEQINESKEMAFKLHKLRLASLYGSIEDSIESSLKISDEELAQYISFAKARLSLAEVDGEVDENATINEGPEWLELFMELPERKNYIFSPEAQQKLIEFGDVKKWINWLKESFEKEQDFMNDLMDQESARMLPADINEVEDKWEISYTLVTPSHALRNSVLQKFNEHKWSVKVFRGKDSHTLIVKLRLGTNVSVDDLVNQGWMSAKLFAAALSIASNGVFYWNIPVDLERFYDSITDVTNNKKLDARLIAGLSLNWSDRRMKLTEEHLHLSWIVFFYFRSVSTEAESKPVSDYARGLAMMAKNDIHLRIEVSIFLTFFQSLLHAVKFHEKCSDSEIWNTAFFQIEAMVKDRESFDRIIAIGEKLQAHEHARIRVTLAEIILIKQYAGMYLMTLAVRHFRGDKSLRLIVEK